ncbi:hypothetical protein MMC12_004145 [Toensbergia leucococca]|nr:hypothetical protein [Toensbergia leucococca]
MPANPAGRPWEATSSTFGTTLAESLPSRPAQLPSIATLTSNLPVSAAGIQQSPTYGLSARERDSGSSWSNQPQSARSSAYSASTNSYYYPSNTHSPHRASNSSQLGITSHPLEFANHPSSAGPQPSPGFAQPQQGLGLPHINQSNVSQYHDNHHHDGSQYRGSQDFGPQESRRSSLGSQVNNAVKNLHINGASPFGSTNASQTSITASLQRERGINSNTNGLRNSRSSAQQPMSPLAPKISESRMAYASRKAPVISANPRRDNMREVYYAEEPTAGQPYAFPDPEMVQRPSASGEDLRPTEFVSRRGSGHTSITSSVVTTDSRLPPGQHRLDEDVSSTHHHSLQHAQVASLQGDSDSPEAPSPYSRTPALRASHKLAERKRRHEMKTLFDALRNQIPSYSGAKSSKWEILTKASDYIKQLEGLAQNGQRAEKDLSRAAHELDGTRRENDILRNENQRLVREMQRFQEGSMHQQTASLQQPILQYNGVAPRMVPDPSRSLPPLTNGALAPSSMQGVQYSEERR